MVMIRDEQLGAISLDTILSKGSQYAQQLKTIKETWQGKPKPKKQVTVIQQPGGFQFTPAMLIGGGLLVAGAVFLLAKKKRR